MVHLLRPAKDDRAIQKEVTGQMQVCGAVLSAIVGIQLIVCCVMSQTILPAIADCAYSLTHRTNMDTDIV